MRVWFDGFLGIDHAEPPRHSQMHQQRSAVGQPEKKELADSGDGGKPPTFKAMGGRAELAFEHQLRRADDAMNLPAPNPRPNASRNRFHFRQFWHFNANGKPMIRLLHQRLFGERGFVGP